MSEHGKESHRQTAIRPEAQESRLPKIGRAGEPIYVFAFRGGGFNTVMQLGVVHALLVSDRRAPDVVSGISAGAVNAAALAEVLRAGAELKDPTSRKAAQVARLRGFLNAYRNAPRELGGTFLPDPYEVEAQAPLTPIELPIHAKRERGDRVEALNGRAGVVRLINDLLAIRLPVHVVTQVIRLILEGKAAGDLTSRWERVKIYGEVTLKLWLLAVMHLWRLGPLAWHIVVALVGPPVRGVTPGEVLTPWRPLTQKLKAVLGILIGFFISLYVLGWPLVAVLCSLRYPKGRVVCGLLLGFLLIQFLFRVLIRGPVRRSALARKIGRRLPHRIQQLARRLYLRTEAIFGYMTGFLLCLYLIGQPIIEWGSHLAQIRPKAGWGAVMRSSLYLYLTSYLVLLIVGGIWYRWRFANKRPSFGNRFLNRVLTYYDLAKEIGNNYNLKQLFVRLFDPDYYGRLNLNKAVARAFESKAAVSYPSKMDSPLPEAAAEDLIGEPNGIEPKDKDSVKSKVLHDYQTTQPGPPVYVAPVAADVKTGRLVTIPESVSIVDALLAAMAIVPLFKAAQLNGSIYIDGLNVANEPTSAVIDYLRNQYTQGRVEEEAAAVYIYTVASFPTTQPDLPGEKNSYTGLVDVIKRVWELRRHQVATLERKLTELYMRLLPTDKAFYKINGKAGGSHEMAGDARERLFVATRLFPIEPERPLQVNQRLTAAASGEAKERIILETVAAGCCATLEALAQPAIGRALTGRTGQQYLKCREAMTAYLGGEFPLPGSQPSIGPGLAEVCQACTLYAGAATATKVDGTYDQSLRARPAQKDWPPWPQWAEDKPNGKPDSMVPHNLPVQVASPQETRAPQDPHPWVTLLFSGGVFRGVFQMGVLNGLNEAKIQPKLLAGSSVGSIMAAMAARLFTEPPEKRRRRIIELAATFLAQDRLILTDRFADFVRRLTLRAGATMFSLRDVDELFRRYDSGSIDHFSRHARQVIAGMERLFFITPFKLLRLAEALRHAQTDAAHQLVQDCVQEFLDRSSIGLEVLGAEPLALLIEHHVAPAAAHGRCLPFDYFQTDTTNSHQIFLLATATDLTQGRLRVIGEAAAREVRAVARVAQATGREIAAVAGPSQIEAPEKEKGQAMLLDALLASSAFPAVFRPRLACEVFPHTKEMSQYVDGGVMDNLPLDAVARFLDQAARHRRVARRPVVGGKAVPHLLFTASLEPKLQSLDEDQEQWFTEHWPSLFRRARQLSYNQKIDAFARSQRNFRLIFEDRKKNGPCWEPLDLEVVAVKPEWLCKTFGFHPMLGFRRVKQAESIAHGCAATLAKLYQITKVHPDWAAGWGIQLSDIDEAAVQFKGKIPRDEEEPRLVPQTNRKDGRCWFRLDSTCPFSREGIIASMAASGSELPDATRKEVENIYQACRRQRTHRPSH